jgi:hypothetical protein
MHRITSNGPRSSRDTREHAMESRSARTVSDARNKSVRVARRLLPHSTAADEAACIHIHYHDEPRQGSMNVTMATHESDLIAPEAALEAPSESPRTDSTSLAVRVEPPTESEGSADFDMEVAIRTIASRILATALLERAQEAESIAT